MELPVPSTFEFEGKVYRIPPLGVADLLEHAKWLRDEHIAEAKRQMVGLPVELASHAWDTARKEAQAIQLSTSAYDDAALTTKSLIHAIWLAGRKDDKELTIATVQSFFDNDNTNFVDIGLLTLGYKRLVFQKPEEPAESK